MKQKKKLLMMKVISPWTPLTLWLSRAVFARPMAFESAGALPTITAAARIASAALPPSSSTST